MHITLNSNVDFLKAEFRHAIVGAIEEAQSATAMVAQQHTPRGATGQLENGYKAIGIVDTATSIRGTVINEVFYARFLEYGTLGNRKKKLSPRTLSRRSSGSGQARLAKVGGGGTGGISPHYFMRAGARAGRKVFFETLKRLAPR